MRTLFLAIFWPSLLLFYSGTAHAWSSYFELGTSLGKISNGNSFFGLTSGAESSNTGFCGSFSFYVPVTSPHNFFHFELGLQNRLTLVSIASPHKDLSMLTPNISMRFELYRFYVGGGYAPMTLVSSGGSGPSGLHPNTGTTAYFFEGGLIWRVVPELQIAATYAMEYGITAAGGSHSPSPATEYGLRFRFPLSPNAAAGDASSKFDGFRYPFGIMK